VRRRIGLLVSRGALRESWLTLAPSFGRATEQKSFALYKKALRYTPKKSNRGMPYDEYRECLACGALSGPKKVLPKSRQKSASFSNCATSPPGFVGLCKRTF